VYRCDPTCCTPDLGKCNILCNAASHPDICRWIDDHLVAIWHTIPLDCPVIPTFPTPERLSKGQKAQSSSLSITFGLTDASPVTAYLNTLKNNFDTTTVVSRTTRNPWTRAVPVEDVSYSFDVTAFPNLPTDKTAHTGTATSETAALATTQGSATAISGITEGILSSALAEVEQKRKNESTDFHRRLTVLESHIASITEKVASMSTEMTDEVMRRLSAPDAPLASQDRVLADQNAKMERMYQMLLSLTGNMDHVTTEVANATVPSTSLALPRSPRGRESPEPHSNSTDACPPRIDNDKRRMTDDGNVIQME
jgi:hypothetical protein